MTSITRYIVLICFLSFTPLFAQQTVGLVLSGGGATGISHVGVLKALEENGIPIDYISGTSAGALIGSMYAAGFSPEEIEAYVLSEDFQLMATGKIKPEQEFLLRENEPSASMFDLSFSKDSLFRKSLPTNLNSSEYLDFQMMSELGHIGASTGNNFDSLFVPFRCVGSDIARKESVIFKDGSLNAAVRASMTFPFLFKPISINNVLFFDGGLYNNFPADVMYHSFSPDYIIGSNVSYNAPPPSDGDLLGQVTTMLTQPSNYELPCSEGYIITPNTSVGTFDFADVAKAIEDGYQSTLAQMDSIKAHVSKRVSPEELAIKRMEFRKKLVPLSISKINTYYNNEDLRYLRLSLIKTRKKEVLTLEELKKRYFRLYETPQVDFLFPTLSKYGDSTYHLDLQVKKAKEFTLSVGGHITSRPVNMGYLGLSYQTIGRIMTKTQAETYFGKFYGSAKASFTIDFPAVYPISSKVYYTMNRWDYFRSFATFFEDVKPSFLVQNEIYGGLEISHPLGNTIKSTFDGRMLMLTDEYYQTDNFTNIDTADFTEYRGAAFSWGITKNSLNRKQFASSGHFIQAQIRYTYGREHSVSGSTAIQPFDIIQNHSWIIGKLNFESYVVDDPNFHLGLSGQVVYNSHPLFANYTATLLTMTEFNLIPDAKTFFLPEYRSHQFLSGGVKAIFDIQKNLELRAEYYYYQPIIRVTQNSLGDQVFSDPFTGQSFVASSSLVYHSFIGPVRFTVNYFPKQENPFSAQFSFGYLLFNERAVR